MWTSTSAIMDEASNPLLVDGKSNHEQDRDPDISEKATCEYSTPEPKHSPKSIHIVPDNCKDANSLYSADSRRAENAILQTPPRQSVCFSQQLYPTRSFDSRELAFGDNIPLRLKQKAINQTLVLHKEADEILKLITLTKNGVQKSLEENLQKETDSIVAYSDANNDWRNKAIKLSERVDEIMRLQVLDRIKAKTKLSNDINQLMANFHVKDIHLNDMTHEIPSETPASLPLWKLKKRNSWNFIRQFDTSLTTVGRATTSCELGKHIFKFDMKKVKDFGNFSAGHDSKPKYYLGVWCSITDDSPLPVYTYIKVSLLNMISDTDNDDISKEGQFMFEMCGQGHGWKQFCSWYNILEAQKSSALFENMFFVIDICISEDSI